MSWFPVDDAFHGHPKGRKAGLEAIGLWTICGSYCMAYLTDGFVPEWFVKEKPRGLALAKRLIDSGLWHPGQKDGEQGFQFHDWKPECTKAHVMDVREKARQRKAKQRESQGESRVTADGTHANVPPTTQPNPTQPITLVDLGGEVTQVDAPEPSPQCPTHKNHTDPPPCVKCKQARLANEAWHSEQKKNELARRLRMKAVIDACPCCDERGMYQLHDDTLARCYHGVRLVENLASGGEFNA